MEIPKNLRIMGLTWTVKQVPDTEIIRTWGDFCFTKSLKFVREHLA